MNHELVMLRGALRMKKNAKELESITKKMAVKSYMTSNTTCDTLATANKIAECVVEKEKMLDFYEAVRSALQLSPRGVSALLNEIYIKRTNKNAICKRYKVSISTLYRKLASARKTFRINLDYLGYSEEWFDSNYGDIDWIADMKSHELGKGGRVSL